jgi:hypothetical protein
LVIRETKKIIWTRNKAVIVVVPELQIKMNVLSKMETEKRFSKRRAHGAVPILLAVLMLCFVERPVHGFFIPGTEVGVGVLGFLRSLEITLETKTSWFYRYFGQNVDPAKIHRTNDCNYGNPKFNIKLCSPVAFNSNLLSPSQNPNMASGLSTSNVEHLSQDNRSSFLSIPSKCLEDPDDPECRHLQIDQAENALPGIGQTQTSNTNSGINDQNIDETDAVPTPAPIPNHAFLTESPSEPPIGATASFAPTRNMCYGNHATFKQSAQVGDEMTNVRGKWCESTMPSVSLEPR